jgi:hypothetical protein
MTGLVKSTRLQRTHKVRLAAGGFASLAYGRFEQPGLGGTGVSVESMVWSFLLGRAITVALPLLRHRIASVPSCPHTRRRSAVHPLRPILLQYAPVEGDAVG